MRSEENSQCFPEKNNETPDTHAIISNLLNRVMVKLRNEFISNLDNSKMNKDKAKRILHITSQIESLLDILLTEMEENGGFCSAYAKRCIDEMKSIKMIMEMEMGENI